MKILIADDDLVSRRLLQKTLMDWGHEVIAVEDGEKAWEVFNKNAFKFVIIDWVMPVLDGLSLCRKIRTSTISGYVYIILLTSKDRREDLIEGLDAGADDYIAKPFDRNELKVKTRTGVRILELEKELLEKNEKLSTLNIRLEELVRMDPLMDIGNRRHFYEIIEKVQHRVSRYKQGYGLIICDIDNFKAYNDTYGHLAGDNILKIVADSIKKSLRKSDDIFRFGGEEIVILLPEQNLDKTIIVAEKIRKDIEALKIEHKGNTFGIITISCGTATSDMDSNWEIILDSADKALYMAKQKGKNQTCFLP